MSGFPFLKEAFLQALADSASVGVGTGWHEQHLSITEGGQLLAFMPTYRKDHSRGEYVFDWAWADAYHRNGLNYYPKLVSAAPFSPVTGPRVRFADNVDRAALCARLFEQAREQAAAQDASGWHLLFPDAQTLIDFEHPELMRRHGVQFHWFNRDYDSFDDFLAGFVARKRKMVRKERRAIADQGISVEIVEGLNIDSDLWRFFYRLYHNTYLKRSGSGGYLTAGFFSQLGETMGENLVMVVASQDDERIACALYFRDDQTLYGRYWGCVREYEFLHFELCYYQGIDYAITRNLKKFDAGAQGEHKILRGFEPVQTHSLHWIRHPGFAEAIARFLEQERRDNSAYITSARALLPYKEGVVSDADKQDN